MNLTIEEMQKILDEAPKTADGYSTQKEEYFIGDVWVECGDISISNLKSKIDQYYYGRSEEEEIEAYKQLREEKIEGGAMILFPIRSMKDLEVMQSGYSDEQIYPHELEVLQDCDIPLNTIIINK